jgi:hypothetical protein
MNNRDASKMEWSTRGGVGATDQEINIGSLQRIADACELMAKNWVQLTQDRDYYKKRSNAQKFFGVNLDAQGGANLKQFIDETGLDVLKTLTIKKTVKDS